MVSELAVVTTGLAAVAGVVLQAYIAIKGRGFTRLRELPPLIAQAEKAALPEQHLLRAELYRAVIADHKVGPRSRLLAVYLAGTAFIFMTMALVSATDSAEFVLATFTVAALLFWLAGRSYRAYMVAAWTHAEQHEVHLYQALAEERASFAKATNQELTVNDAEPFHAMATHYWRSRSPSDRTVLAGWALIALSALVATFWLHRQLESGSRSELGTLLSAITLSMWMVVAGIAGAGLLWLPARLPWSTWISRPVAALGSSLVVLLLLAYAEDWMRVQLMEMLFGAGSFPVALYASLLVASGAMLIWSWMGHLVYQGLAKIKVIRNP